MPNHRNVRRIRGTDAMSLDDIRKKIDSVDAELLRLLSKRASLAKDIGAIKGKDDRPFFTPEREREIFERLSRDNPGPLIVTQLSAIYREIISVARAAEKPFHIAYWGPPGSFTHIAAMQTFGGS